MEVDGDFCKESRTSKLSRLVIPRRPPALPSGVLSQYPECGSSLATFENQFFFRPGIANTNTAQQQRI